MADQYIDTDYMRSRMGEGLLDGLTTRLGADLTSAIESATALVQAALRGKGYTPSAVADDEAVKLAVYAATWELLSTMPRASLKLPENWSANLAKLTLDSLVDPAGALELSVPPSTSRGPGGSQWTDTSSTSDQPRRTSADELAGY